MWDKTVDVYKSENFIMFYYVNIELRKRLTFNEIKYPYKMMPSKSYEGFKNGYVIDYDDDRELEQIKYLFNICGYDIYEQDN